MDAWLPTMVQYLLVIATNILKCVGEYENSVERPVFVDAIGEGMKGGGEPEWVYGNWTKGSEDVPKQFVAIDEAFIGPI